MKQFWIQRPFYWGYEPEASGKQFGIAWLAQAEPPFYFGKALRVRIKDRAYHLGICRKAKTPFVRPVEKTPKEIGSWR